MRQADVIIVGGGIVGLATAFRFLEAFPKRKIIVLEKEAQVAAHQTGHNSGVLHSGIYYKPGSLKAENCREGRRDMVEFCREENIAHDVCGKVIVATREDEFPSLDRIYERGQANRVACELIDRQQLLELEPHCAGIRAIHVPEAGIVNYRQVCERLAARVEAAGSHVVFNTRVKQIVADDKSVSVVTTDGEYLGGYLVNCAGLYCDRVSKLAGSRPRAKIVPFRGEYFDLLPEATHLCRNLIYPVPDPQFPFLGVHFTRMIAGGVECGPNAVLAFAREGYRKTDINVRDLAETLTYPGFLRLAAKHWKMGMGEMWRSYSKRAFVAELKRLIPEIEPHHLVAAGSGVRAQAVLRDGALVDDFLIQESHRIVHVQNAPSPAATASLNIGRQIVELLDKHR